MAANDPKRTLTDFSKMSPENYYFGPVLVMRDQRKDVLEFVGIIAVV